MPRWTVVEAVSLARRKGDANGPVRHLVETGRFPLAVAVSAGSHLNAVIDSLVGVTGSRGTLSDEESAGTAAERVAGNSGGVGNGWFGRIVSLLDQGLLGGKSATESRDSE
jgi:hypothetical protein